MLLFLVTISQVEVICETREDWWNALLAWLRSLGGSKGICDILQRLLNVTNSLNHLVDCNLSSNPDEECSDKFLANKLAWLKEQDVANTDQMNFTTKALLVVVVLFVHLVLATLILALVLPFICNAVASYKTKLEEVLEETKRTRSTSKTRSTRRSQSTRRNRSTRRRTPRRSRSAKAAKQAPSDNMLTLSSKAQVSLPLT